MTTQPNATPLAKMSDINAHTPGPWGVFESLPLIGVTASDMLTGDIAHCVGFDSNRTVDEERANARLIAAAPDLLSAMGLQEGGLVLLREAISAGDPATELALRIDDMLREARAAIAKATTPAEVF